MVDSSAAAASAAADPAAATSCPGCGAEVPDIDGPAHRYIGASPGCWAIFAELTGTARLAMVPAPHGPLAVDAYAVQHPGVPGPQSTQSVWVHLVALHLMLEKGWSADQAIRIRKAAADASAGWPWLEPPASLGPLTIVDVARVAGADAGGLAAEHQRIVREWVVGCWEAWSAAHPQVRATAAKVVGS